MINNGMHYTIYQITNTVNGKVYIGKHQTENLDDGYFGSGIALRAAIAYHGKDNFSKEILHVFETEDEMNAKERELITEEFVSRKDTYNLGVGGEGGPHFKGRKHTAESIAKRTASRRGYTHSQETRQKISEANRNRVISDKTRKKLSEKAKTRRQTPETRAKIAEAIRRKHKLKRGSEEVSR